MAIDPVLLALTRGAAFMARSFSGDEAPLVPVLKAGLSHTGRALIDVSSPCVIFYVHEGSTERDVSVVAMHDTAMKSPRDCCSSTKTGRTCTR